MYCEFYGMRERPFNVTADPKFLYLNARYREALASLHYGVTQRKGFITLIGEAGTGKTTLLKKLLNDLDPNTRTVFVFNTNVTFDEILEYIFGEFDLPIHNGKRLYMLQRLNAFLLDELREGRNVALLVDEAQDLDYTVLEDLRLLSNLETSKEKILQIVLAGQPELGQKLTNPNLRQLRQRVAVNCRLMPLTREELSEYIQSRLSSAGCSDQHLFSRDAEERVYQISGGIPRIVNVVCDNALVIGYAMGKKRLSAEVVDEAAADLIATEGAPEVMAATRAQGEDEPAGESTWTRWMSPRAVMAVAAMALLVGLLSVGRTFWKGGLDLAGENNPAPLEVVQPGLSDRFPPVAAVRERPAPARSDRRYASERDGRAAAGQREYERFERPLAGEREAVGIGDLSEPQEPYEEPAPLPRPAAEPVAPRARLDAADRHGRPTWDDLDDPPIEIDVPLVDPPPAPAAPEAPVAAAAEEDAAEAGTGEPVRMRLALHRYQYVQVAPDDSISEIAIRNYGQASPTILDLMKMANPKIDDINRISPGQTLRLPQLEQGLVLLRQSDGSYGLLLVSLLSRGRANEIRSALRRQGFGARVSSAGLGGGRSVWRVIVADLENREVALGVGKDLQQLFRRDRRIAAMAQP